MIIGMRLRWKKSSTSILSDILLALSRSISSEKATILANGISTAMNTTAFGLIVAIPCIAAYTFISAFEKDLLLSYDEVSSEVIHSLVFTEEAE